MKFLFLIIPLSFSFSMLSQSSDNFFNYKYNDSTGKIILTVKTDDINKEFLYVSSLATGVGSNDIGLDRGQLGGEKVVKFVKAGDKLLLTQVNYDYRAMSYNLLERRAVEQAFAQSILWGFKLLESASKDYQIDITDFLLRDAHQIVKKLNDKKQGKYKLDKSRSAIYKTKSFVDNTEFESTTTYVGEAKGKYIKSVVPSSGIVTVRQHHSFVRLPDNNFRLREFHPFSGYYPLDFKDYATPIDQPLTKRYIYRHRLNKKNPSKTKSEPEEPIIYYIDAGCPEPIKSALMEGGAWWNQAFEEAGFIDAFQVKELPEGADPMDVRYNMIQWVHRSTRGWSYGSTVSDPRTGEIIKGHVSLGSLRVRQDFMIAQGILSPFGGDMTNPTNPLMQLALARLRQLAAHEIGHTIGLTHNFAASVDGRASVMDYPHPLINWEGDDPDFSNAYDTRIGDWDKRMIVYGYSEFTKDQEESEELKKIIDETQKMGFKFIEDADARPMGSLHPDAHLWDNGASPIDELERLIIVRKKALDRFGENTIPVGTPYSELEKILVPVYLMHRYQVDAVSKLIGGVQYNYNVKGDMLDHKIIQVAKALQEDARIVLLKTLDPKFLTLPSSIVELIPPAAYGYPRNNESFESRTGIGFDRFAIASSSIEQTLRFLLQSDRLSRLNQISDDENALNNHLNTINNSVFVTVIRSSEDTKLRQLVQKQYVQHLAALSTNKKIDQQVVAMARYHLKLIQRNYCSSSSSNPIIGAHIEYLSHFINEVVTGHRKVELPKEAKLPPGSPIGCGHGF